MPAVSDMGLWLTARIANWIAANPEKVIILGLAYSANPKLTNSIVWLVARSSLTHAWTLAKGVGLISYEQILAPAAARYAAPVSATSRFALGRVILPFVAGYTLGAVAGTTISYAAYGETGAKDAIRLYTGQVSPAQYNAVVFNDPSGRKFAWFDRNIGAPIRSGVNKATFGALA